MLPAQSTPRNTAKPRGSSTRPRSPFHGPPSHTPRLQLSPKSQVPRSPDAPLPARSQPAPPVLPLLSHPGRCSPRLRSLASFPLHMHALKVPQLLQLWARKKGHENFVHYIFLSLRLSVLMLSLPQAVLPEILVAIKEKSKVIPKHLGKRTNINHISSTFGSAWKTNCM